MKKEGYLDMHFDNEARKYGLIIVLTMVLTAITLRQEQNWKFSTRKENGFLQSSLRTTLNTVLKVLDSSLETIHQE